MQLIEEVQQELSPQKEFALSADIFEGLPESIEQSESYGAYAQRAYISYIYGKDKQAHTLALQLRALLKTATLETQKTYEPIIALLWYAAFPRLTAHDIETLCAEYDITLYITQPEYFNLEQQIRDRLATEPFDTRDAWRKRMYDAMHRNTVIVTKAFIQPQQQGSVSAWLKAYDQAVGLGLAETFERVDFENKMSVAAHLSTEEKTKLKALYDFYEFVKLTSESLVGFEEDIVVDTNEGLFMFTSGQEIQITKKQQVHKTIESSTIEQQTATQAIPPMGDILQTRNTLLQESKGDTQTLIAKLVKAIDQQNKLETLGVLILLAQLHTIDAVVQHASVQKLIQDDLQQAGKQELLAGFKSHPASPQYIARLLKIILEEKMSIPTNESIVFGERLRSILSTASPKYHTLVIEKEGKNVWGI